MIWLFDGFNLIYKVDELEDRMHKGDLEGARIGLLKVLKSFVDKAKRTPEIWVFFDGKKKKGDETRQETLSGMNCVYSHDLSADFLIKEYIRLHRHPSDIAVVSSDKDVIAFAKRFRTHRHTSEDFVKNFLLAGKGTKEAKNSEKNENPVLTAKELDYWKNLFRGGS